MCMVNVLLTDINELARLRLLVRELDRLKFAKHKGLYPSISLIERNIDNIVEEQKQAMQNKNIW